jgi:hypothetical protein
LEFAESVERGSEVIMTFVSRPPAGSLNATEANVGLGPLTPATAGSPRSRSQAGGWSLVGVSAVAIVLTFWFIHRFAVNTVLFDNWNDVRLIGRANSGVLTFGDLWAQHGENRIFLPNLFVLGLAHTVRFNIVDEDYLNGMLLALTASFLILAHRRRSPSTPWLYYVPVVVTVLSLNQGTMTLFGFALSWYLEIFALSVSLFLLDRQALTWPTFVGAAAAGIGGSFSSLEGLLIWPVGLLLLYHRSRGRPLVIAWIAVATVTTVCYFSQFNFRLTDSNNTYDFHHPLEALRFFFFAIGNVLGITISDSPSLGDYAVLLFGVVVFIVACWVLIMGIPRPAKQTGASIGVALVLFGLLYTVSLSVGRAGFGLIALPRYAIFDLILLAGCYLAVVDGSLFSRSHGRVQMQDHRAARTDTHLRRGKQPCGRFTTPGSGMRTSILLVLVVLILIQVGVGTSEAFNAADAWHAHELTGADITANIDKAPDDLVQQYLGSGFQTAQFIRDMAGVAKVDHLSLFGTQLATQFEHRGLTVERTPPSNYIIRPIFGSTVTGSVVLDALASEPYGISRVEFTLAQKSGGPSTVIGLASKSFYGWILRWNSISVPNGRYVFRSTAFDTIGTSTTSVGVLITVKN